MAFVKYPPETTSEAIDVFNQDVPILHEVIHGNEDEQVLTENGLIPPVSKVLKDIFDNYATINNTGDWQPSTGYTVRDIWRHTDRTWYLVLSSYTSHTSDIEQDVSSGNVGVYQLTKDYTYFSVDEMKNLLNERGGSVGSKFSTISYYEGGVWGGNDYILIDGQGSRPAEDGGSIIHVGSGDLYLKGLFPNGVWIEQFGASPSIDNSEVIMSASGYCAENYIPNLLAKSGVYPSSNLTTRKGVILQGEGTYTPNVLDIATPDETGRFVIKCIDSDDETPPPFLLADGVQATHSGIHNLIIDASDYSGDVVVLTALDGIERRLGFSIINCLIYKGTERQIYVSSLANETLIKNTFCRGGPNRDGAISKFGIVDESQDSRIFETWCAFHKIRGIYDAGGAGRRTNIDTWGCQEWGTEIVAAVTYDRLQSDGNGYGGVRLNNAKNAHIYNIKTISNGHNQPEGGIGGDFEVIGDCRGSSIVGGELRGSSFGTIASGLYKDDTTRFGIAVTDLVIGTAYTTPINPEAEAYFDLVNVRSTSFPLSFTKSRQINPNINFNYYTVIPATGATPESLAPTGWITRNNGNSALSTTIVPTGYRTSVEVFSAPDGTGEAVPEEYLTSGIQFELSGDDLNQVRNSRIRLKMLVRGSGSTFQSNQFIQIFDNVNNPIVEINNNAIWEQLAFIYDVPDSATTFQVRLIASNSNIPNLSIHVTALTIEVY